MSARKTGIMVVGLAGNNGSSLLAAHILAKQGQMPMMLGSLASVGTLPVSQAKPGESPVYSTFRDLVPSLLRPEDVVIGGWDIRKMTMEQAMVNAKVLDRHTIEQVKYEANKIKVLPSCNYPSFVAENQHEMANNCLVGHTASPEHLEQVRLDIRDFKMEHKLDVVVVLYSGSTERYMETCDRVHGSAEGLVRGVQENNPEISPSLIFGIAAMQEGCVFVNAAPQNTVCDGLIDLAHCHNGYICGSDARTGQTLCKVSMIEYLTHRGLKTKSITSNNGLGNNDGRNLQGRRQFKSKEISKGGVLDDTLKGNRLLHPSNDVEHMVRIEYVKEFGDEKRATDTYMVDTIFGKRMVIDQITVCPDTALAVPILFDMVIFGEYLTRPSPTHHVLSSMAFFFKKPEVNTNEYVFNGFSVTRKILENAILRSVSREPVTIRAML